MREIMQSAHFGFILAAYAVTVATVLGMIGAIILDHRALRRALERFANTPAARENEK
jgi:heme exporter protein CcmD